MEEDQMEELFTPVSTEQEPSGYHIQASCALSDTSNSEQSYLLFGETRFDLPPRYSPLVS